MCTNSAALPVELPPSAGDEGSKQGAWAQKWAQWWAVVPDQKSDTFVSTPDVFKELLLLSSPNTLWLAIGFVALVRCLQSHELSACRSSCLAAEGELQNDEQH